MSSGSRTRPIGLAIGDDLAISSNSARDRCARSIGVSVIPGDTTFAVTPADAPSSAATLMRATSPALEAAYAAPPRVGRTATPELIATIRPVRRLIIAGRI